MTITIDEAIKELLDIELRVPVMRPQKQRDALAIGREALKRLSQNRKCEPELQPSLLPSETIE